MKEEKPSIAVVWGAGGIGTALTTQLVQKGQYDQVIGVSRRKPDDPVAGAECLVGDFLDEGSIQTVTSAVRGRGQLKLVIVATGVLHDADVQPEKSMRSLSLNNLKHVHRVNCIGPSLVAKHLIPIMPNRERSVFAAISARVGSISDNRLGGWHAYRSSKAALNMMLKGLSIEWTRRNPESICVGLHPGTVDTDLSKPFQKGVPEQKLFSPEYSARMLIDTLNGLKNSDTGLVFDYAGEPVPA